MNSSLTELVFILDQSGSMFGLETDTIGGFNAMLEKQKQLADPCRITTVLFDTKYTLLHDRLDLCAVRPLSEKDYSPGGCTALLDAVGNTIQKLIGVQKNSTAVYRAEKVVFVIITDGQENASREFTADQIRAMIKRQQEVYGWEFIFLGANIDAVSTAARYGIREDRSAGYISDPQGTQLNFEAMSQMAADFRNTGKISQEPMQRIRKDLQKRMKSRKKTG